jgi:DNA-binding NarL/FixJ family response regulator
MPSDPQAPFARRVLVVEDEEFTRSIVASGLESLGFNVRSAPSVAEALDALQDFEPHAVVTDLDFGSGPNGIDLITRISEDQPWVGCVILTSHAAVELAVGQAARLPAGVVYVVKSSIHSIADLLQAVESSLSAVAARTAVTELAEPGSICVTSQQAETLKLIAEGLSNSGIAKRRGTSLRSAESLVQRTLQALDIPQDPDFNPRVIAVRMWQQGKVVVR